MERIKRLTEETINKIAAGEVIDRPASVLKELVENSLDAGGTTITVRVEDAGLSHIEVKDNGTGMGPEGVRMALLRHTTSKIEGVSDLAAIHSFGFRGEALASIAAVSKIEIASIQKGLDEGVGVRVDGGEIIDEIPISGRQGTIVNVSELFYNTPARKKFLKSRKVELNSLRSTFWDLAIPCGGVDFRFLHPGGDEITVSSGLEIPDRVRLKEKEIGDTFQVFEEVSPYFSIHGLVSSPDRTFPRSNRISMFVNKRAVRDGICVAAVKEGLRGLIPENRFPCAYIFIDVSPDDADFNVHPAKKEVRFRYRRELFELIRHALKRLFFSEKRGYHIAPDFRIESDFEDFSDGGSKKANGSSGATGDVPYSEEKEAEELQDRLFERVMPFSKMKVIGQVLGNYILIDGGEELLFLDIHAASERVNYWKIFEGFKGWLERPEHLLISVMIPAHRLGGSAEDVKAVLVKAGYCVEFSKEVLEITAVPVYLKGVDPLEAVDDLLEILKSESPDGITGSEKVLEELMGRMACHISLRGTRHLPEAELRFLLEELDRAIYSRTCPHGRPVFIKVTRGELHRLFGRT